MIQPVTERDDVEAAVCARVTVSGTPFRGVGLGASGSAAAVDAVLAAVNRVPGERP